MKDQFQQDIQEQKTHLEQTMHSLLRRIEDNQKIQSRFQSFESQLFQCDGLLELLDTLLLISLSHFELEEVSLLLNDSDHQMRTLSEQLQISSYEGRLQFFHNPVIFDNLFAHSASQPKARLGALDFLEATKIFPQARKIKSSALLPLIRRHKIIGCINFGSSNAERFTADKSPDFLEHLAMVTAVCLENSFSLEFLRHQSSIDVLTQIYNRRSFDSELEKELSRAARQGHSLACLFMDIDHFKQVNDTYGHQSGDECLRQVAKAIKTLLRKTDILARYGGEEFVVLLPEQNIEHAQQTAERIREHIANLTIDMEGGKEAEEKYFQVTISIGVSSIEGAAINSPVGSSTVSTTKEGFLEEQGEALLSGADQAMYQAKNSGRNKVCYL